MGKVKDTLQASGRKVEQQSNPAGYAPGKPDMTQRACQLNMPHPLPANLGACYLNAAFITDYPLKPYPLIFAAGTFEVLGRAKDSLAEEAVPLRFQRAVVDCLRLGYLTIGPA